METWADSDFRFVRINRSGTHVWAEFESGKPRCLRCFDAASLRERIANLAAHGAQTPAERFALDLLAAEDQP